MEEWKVLDENRQNLKQTMLRGEAFMPNTYHQVVYLWVENYKNQWLIQ